MAGQRSANAEQRAALRLFGARRFCHGPGSTREPPSREGIRPTGGPAVRSAQAWRPPFHTAPQVLHYPPDWHPPAAYSLR